MLQKTTKKISCIKLLIVIKISIILVVSDAFILYYPSKTFVEEAVLFGTSERPFKTLKTEF